jgi:hypothetical protein
MCPGEKGVAQREDNPCVIGRGSKVVTKKTYIVVWMQTENYLRVNISALQSPLKTIIDGTKYGCVEVI